MFESIISSELTPSAFFICTAVSLILGIGTAAVGMFKSRSTQSFAITLAILPVTVQLVIMLVNGNIGAGVAVAGAFSLVRFRSAPGNAREICALFCAMAVGLATGMGYVAAAGVFFAVVSAATLALAALNFGGRGEAERVLKVTIPEDTEYNGLFDDLFAKYTRACRLEKVKTANMGTLYELCYRITLKDEKDLKDFIDGIRCRNGNLGIVCSREADRESL